MNEKNKQELLLLQWQSCVELANAVSQRRDSMNNLMATMNIGILTAVSLIWDLKSLIISVAGIILCVFWIRLIKYYKCLNAAKYDVILKLEEQLPDQPMKKEWDIYCGNKKNCEGTKIEIWLPSLFITIYAILIIVLCILTISA